MQKLLFILPPKKYFYGFDLKMSEDIINCLRKRNIQVEIFDNIEIFLNKLSLVKIFKIYLKYKFKNFDYVISINAGYINLCNLKLFNNYFNFFADILKIKCICRWDHIHEQISNIALHYISKYSEKYTDLLKFYFNKINSKNYINTTWHHDEFTCSKNLVNNLTYPFNLKLKYFDFFFCWKKKNELNFNKNIINKKSIYLSGYVNLDLLDNNTVSEKLIKFYLQKKIKKKSNEFYNIKMSKDIRSSSSIIYNKKKIDLLNKKIKFYGTRICKNSFENKYININNFMKKLANFFIVVSPSQPINFTLTQKFYAIYYYGGFCICEKPIYVPKALKKLEKYIFYSSYKQLCQLINFYSNNYKKYLKIKIIIRKLSIRYMHISEKSMNNFFNYE